MNKHPIDPKLKSFLENEVLKTHILQLFRLRRGGASLNYKIVTKDGSFLLKMLSSSNPNRIKNFLSIYQNLNNVPNLAAPHLCPPTSSSFLVFNNKVLFLMNFIEGSKITSDDLTDKVLSQIVENYRILLANPLKNNDFVRSKILPADLYHHTCEKISDIAQKSLFLFYRKKILSVLKNIVDHVPDIKTTPIIIHGDTGPNNFILNQKGELFFLDFEMIRYGYLSEDLAQFILSVLLQRRIWFFDKKKFARSVRFFNDAFHLSFDDWLYGCSLYFLRLGNRRAQPKILKSPRKAWLCLKHLHKYEKIVHILKTLY